MAMKHGFRGNYTLETISLREVCAMKSTEKNLLLFITVCLTLLLSAAACTEANKSRTTFSFNLSGAKAVGGSKVGDTSLAPLILPGIRYETYAEDSFGLFKILDDGTIETVIDSNAQLTIPEINFIAKSPVAGSKDTYVHFKGPLQYVRTVDGENQYGLIREFLHIKEDGSYVEILTPDDDMHTYLVTWGSGTTGFKPVHFDNDGNVYFFTGKGNYADPDGHVNIVWRYSPSTGTKTALTQTAVVPPYNDHWILTMEVDPAQECFYTVGYDQRVVYEPSLGYGLVDHDNCYFWLYRYNFNDMQNPVEVFKKTLDSKGLWLIGYLPDGSLMLNGLTKGFNGIQRVSFSGDTINFEQLYSNMISYALPYKPGISKVPDRPDFDPESFILKYDGVTQCRYGLFNRGENTDLKVLMTDGSDFLHATWYDLFSSPAGKAASAITIGDITYTIGTDIWFAIDRTNAALYDSEPYASWDSFEALGKTPLYSHDTQVGVVADDQTITQYTYDRVMEPMDPVTAGNIMAAITAPTNAPVYYIWDSNWYVNNDRTNAINAQGLLAYLDTLFIEEADFISGTDTNAAAIQALGRTVFTDDDIWPYNGVDGKYDYYNFLIEHMVKAGTGTTHVQNIAEYLDANNIQSEKHVYSVYTDSTNTVWGIAGYWSDPNGTLPYKLLNPDGTRDMKLATPFAGLTYHSMGFTQQGDYLYFQDQLLDENNAATGNHKLYRYSMTGDTVEDMLVNVPENGTFAITSYSVSASTLYFSGTQGETTINGRINVDTKEYTPLDSSRTLTNIVVY